MPAGRRRSRGDDRTALVTTKGFRGTPALPGGRPFGSTNPPPSRMLQQALSSNERFILPFIGVHWWFVVFLGGCLSCLPDLTTPSPLTSAPWRPFVFLRVPSWITLFFCCFRHPPHGAWPCSRRNPSISRRAMLAGEGSPGRSGGRHQRASSSSSGSIFSSPPAYSARKPSINE